MWSSVFSKTFIKRLPVGLALAVLLSLLFHLMILGSEYWQLPSLDFADPDNAKSTDQVQQVHLQAAPVAELPPVPKPKARRERKKAQPEPVVPAASAEEPVSAQEPQAELPAVGMAEEGTEEGGTAIDAAEPEALEPPVAEAGMADAVEAEAHELPAFTYVDTEFVVLRGENGSKIGATKVSYRMYEDGRYELTSTTEAKGLASLVVSGKLLQQSEGRVTADGLQPDYFSYQYGKGDNKKQQSRFDWEQRKVTLETVKGVKTVDLPEGSQDLLSFMYQFIFLPPLEQMTLHISNGKKLSEYSYGFEGEETLETDFGAVRTWHIARAGEGSEKTELWLAVDYHYLPVKMRKTEEDGSVIEQLATRISTDLLK